MIFEPNRTGVTTIAGMKVWYHAPVDPLTAPVLFVIHGVNRNAADYRDTWAKVAPNVLLLCPEFDTVDWPDWTTDVEAFQEIDRIFRRLITSRRTYSLYGHSAGAQFVHRFMMTTPNKCRWAVAANAGWYTMPNTDRWPYGMGDWFMPSTGAPFTFGFDKRMTILAGELDTDPDDPNLRHNEIVDRQGLNRFARSLHFYDASAYTAAKAGVPFRWDWRSVPNVGHSNREIAPTAYKILEQR